MMGIRIDPKMKEFFQQMAEQEDRNLSNFIIHAVITYIRENKGIDWKQNGIVQVKPLPYQPLTSESPVIGTVHESAQSYGNKKKE